MRCDLAVFLGPTLITGSYTYIYNTVQYLKKMNKKKHVEIHTFGSSVVGDASPCDWESAGLFCRDFGVFLTF